MNAVPHAFLGGDAGLLPMRRDVAGPASGVSLAAANVLVRGRFEGFPYRISPEHSLR